MTGFVAGMTGGYFGNDGVVISGMTGGYFGNDGSDAVVMTGRFRMGGEALPSEWR